MTDNDPSSGYSLAELAMALACTVLLVTAATPGLVRLQKDWALWGEARSLESSLQWARSYAVSANTTLRFEVDDSRREFWWIDPESGDPYLNSVRRLSSGIRITRIPGRPVRFYQQGNAAPAGTYTIAGETGAYSVIVAPGGRIRIQKE